MKMLLSDGKTINVSSRCRRARGGFTLLEVMIAVSILAVAFTAILASHTQSIQLTIRTKELNIAGFLVHNLMVESEHIVDGKPFSELPKSEEGTYPEPYQQYKWKREIKEITFPNLTAGMNDANEDGRTDQNQGGSEGIMKILGEATSKYVSKAVRELVVTVSWNKGQGEQKVQLATYLVSTKEPFSLTP